MSSFKPSSYPTVSAYLIVTDAAATIHFVTSVFAAKEIRRFADDAGRIMHAEVRIEDSVIMIADAADGWPALPAHIHIYVEDVDATYAQSMSFGAESVQVPVKKDDADKRGGVKDSGGTTWWIATKVE